VDERRLGAAGRPSQLRFNARARQALAADYMIMLIHDGCGNIVEFKASPLYACSKGKIADGRLPAP
jgi:hypothetical protein